MKIASKLTKRFNSFQSEAGFCCFWCFS